MFDKLHIGLTARDNFYCTSLQVSRKISSLFETMKLVGNNVEYMRKDYFFHYISLEFSVTLILKETSHQLAKLGVVYISSTISFTDSNWTFEVASFGGLLFGSLCGHPKVL